MTVIVVKAIKIIINKQAAYRCICHGLLRYMYVTRWWSSGVLEMASWLLSRVSSNRLTGICTRRWLNCHDFVLLKKRYYDEYCSYKAYLNGFHTRCSHCSAARALCSYYGIISWAWTGASLVHRLSGIKGLHICAVPLFPPPSLEPGHEGYIGKLPYTRVTTITAHYNTGARADARI